MKTQTLQEQYNSIKAGKGNKEQFLKQARSLFPQHVTKFLDYDTSVRVLKSKQIISEIAESPKHNDKFNIFDWKKSIIEKPIESENGVEYAKDKKSKDDFNKNAYNSKDTKNSNNINFNEILKGFYAELKDEKNHDKTAEELRDIAIKNLSKDPLYYTKDGEFGEKGVGYKDDAPGLGKPIAPKGKHKSSGYGDLNTKEEPKTEKSNVKADLGEKEAKTTGPKKVKEMDVTPQNSKGVKKFDTPGKEKKIKLKEGKTLSELLKEDEKTQLWNEGDKVMLKDDPSMDVKAGIYTVVYHGPSEDEEMVYILRGEDGKENEYTEDYIENKGYWKDSGVGVGKFSPKLNEITESDILPPTEVKVGMMAYYGNGYPNEYKSTEAGEITHIFQDPELAKDLEILDLNIFFVDIEDGGEIAPYGLDDIYVPKNGNGDGGERAPKEEEPNKERGKISHWSSIGESHITFKVGDIVIPNIGPYKGQDHKIIHVREDGKYNIQPLGDNSKYHLGAAAATADQLTKKIEEAYMGNSGDEVMISPTSKNPANNQPFYVLEKPDGSAMVDMRFDSTEEAKKYADKKGLKIVDKPINESNKPSCGCNKIRSLITKIVKEELN